MIKAEQINPCKCINGSLAQLRWLNIKMAGSNLITSGQPLPGIINPVEVQNDSSKR